MKTKKIALLCSSPLLIISVATPLITLASCGKKVSDISLSESPNSIEVNDSLEICATLKYSNKNEKITWTQDNCGTQGLVEFSKTESTSGSFITIKAKNTGTVEIKASCDIFVATRRITIQPSTAVTEITSVTYTGVSGVGTDLVDQTFLTTKLNVKGKTFGESQEHDLEINKHFIVKDSTDQDITKDIVDGNYRFGSEDTYNYKIVAKKSSTVKPYKDLSIEIMEEKTITLTPDAEAFIDQSIELKDETPGSIEVTNNLTEGSSSATWELKEQKAGEEKFTVELVGNGNDNPKVDVLVEKNSTSFTIQLATNVWKLVEGGKSYTLIPEYVNKRCDLEVNQDFSEYFTPDQPIQNKIEQKNLDYLELHCTPNYEAYPHINGTVYYCTKADPSNIIEQFEFVDRQEKINYVCSVIPWNKIKYGDVIELHFESHQ